MGGGLCGRLPLFIRLFGGLVNNIIAACGFAAAALPACFALSDWFGRRGKAVFTAKLTGFNKFMF